MSSKKTKFCPIRTQQATYHHDKNNPYLLPLGPNRKIDYDISNTHFLPCIEEECAWYDPFDCRCAAVNSETTNIVDFISALRDSF